MTFFIFVLLAASIAFGNLYKISFFSPDVRVSLLDLAVTAITCVALFSRVRKQFHPGKTIVTSLTLFSGWSFFSLVLSISHFGITAGIVGFFYWLRFLVYSLLGFSLIRLLSPIHLKKLTYLCGFLFVAMCSFQYLIFPDIRSLQVAEWDPHYYRVVGTLLDPGFVGILLVLFLLFQLRYPLTNKLHFYLGLGLTYLVFALTYSRSSFIGLAAAAISISWTRHSWRPFLLTGFLLLVTVIVLPRSPDGEGVKLERTSSITARIINWQHSLQIFAASPVTGVGFNTYRYAQKTFGFLDNSVWLKSHAGAGADSSLLFVAATTGTIGLLLYLNYLRSLLLLRTVNHELSALLVHSLFLNSLFYPFVLFWLGLLIALKFTSTESNSPLVQPASGSPLDRRPQ